MADLKELLGEELFDQVQEALDDDTQLIVNDGDYIPRERLNEKNEKIEALESQLEERDSQIDQLKKDTNASEELQQKIEELQEQNEKTQQELEQKLEQQRLESGVEKALLRNNARNPQAVKALLDLDSVKVDEDEVKGLEPQLKELRESDPYLFEGDGSSSGGDEGFSGDDGSPLTKEMIDNMSEKEINERWDEIETFLENS